MSVPNPKKLLFQTDLTDVSSTDIEGVGNIREDAQGNVFRWVKFDEATNSTCLQYGMVCYDSELRTEVKQPTTGQRINVAGAFQAAITGGNFGWIRCKGKGFCNVIQSGTNSSQSIAAITAFASNFIITNAQYYLTQSAAVAHIPEIYIPTSLASSSSNSDVAPAYTTNLEMLLNCRL